MTNKQKVLLLGSITVLFWASAFPMTKVAQAQFSSGPLAFLRCVVASSTLLILGYFLKIRLPKKKDIIYFLCSGCCGFGLYMYTFNTGMQTLTSATSSIIIALTPILTAVCASKLYKERINSIGWVCIGTAFLGVLTLLLWDGILSIEVGVLWTLVSAILFCIYNILSRRLLRKGYTSYEIATYSILGGAFWLLPFCVQGVRELAVADASSVLSIVYLALFPSALSFISWGKAMGFARKTSEVTNFMFMTPLISTIIGFLLLKEIPNMGTFVGGAIIIISIVIFNRSADKEIVVKTIEA